MQKKSLTFMAAALVAGVAFAQSGPTVYGVADLSLESVSATGSTAGAAGNDIPSHTRLNANSSLFGVKGKLDVGGGNAVIYQFETYIDLGNSQYGSGNAASVGSTGTTVTGNSGTLSSVFGARRDTFVGMTGNWGTLKAGYLTSGFRGAVAKCDLAPGATGVTAGYEVFGAAGLGKNWFQRYTSVMYTTPDFSGFSAALNYIPNTQKAVEPGTVDPGGWDLLARYETKLFHVTFVHTDLKDLLFGGYTAESNKSDALFAGINFSDGHHRQRDVQREQGHPEQLADRQQRVQGEFLLHRCEAEGGQARVHDQLPVCRQAPTERRRCGGIRSELHGPPLRLQLLQGRPGLCALRGHHQRDCDRHQLQHWRHQQWRQGWIGPEGLRCGSPRRLLAHFLSKK